MWEETCATVYCTKPGPSGNMFLVKRKWGAEGDCGGDFWDRSDKTIWLFSNLSISKWSRSLFTNAVQHRKCLASPNNYVLCLWDPHTSTKESGNIPRSPLSTPSHQFSSTGRIILIMSPWNEFTACYFHINHRIAVSPQRDSQGGGGWVGVCSIAAVWWETAESISYHSFIFYLILTAAHRPRNWEKHLVAFAIWRWYKLYEYKVLLQFFGCHECFSRKS